MRFSVLHIIFLQLFASAVYAQKNLWTIEAEDASSVVTWKEGMADIVAPKGLTLWFNEEMIGNTYIEYDAQVVSDERFKDKDGNIRISDLNCFWMASEKDGGSVLKGVKKRGGRFVNSYTMQLYYMGYGGNWNTTTRFRRYNADARGVDDAQYRPGILKEYTDKAHLLKAGHWYHVKVQQEDGRVMYVIDGDTLVNYLDPYPLMRGRFGFRTTLSHVRLKNFHKYCVDKDRQPVMLRWIGNTTNNASTPVTFGVPFAKGEKKDDVYTLTTLSGKEIACDTWRLASWPDGSAKWQAFAAVVPAGTEGVELHKGKLGKEKRQRQDDYAAQPLCFTMTLNGKESKPLRTTLEQHGRVRATWRYDFDDAVVRSYHYKGSSQVKVVHTLLVDSTLNKDGLKELALHFKVAMHGKPYERYVELDGHKMSVQPLIARRKIDLGKMDKVTVDMLSNIAQWDGYRLSQLSPNGYSIRKRATSNSPWIGTIEGQRSQGRVMVGDSLSATLFQLEDFWQSYPSTLQVDGARSDSARVSICLYSPEAEPYCFEHYDTIPHGLEAAYEDIQPGMSTAWGIGRTSTIYITSSTKDADCLNDGNDSLSVSTLQLVPSPEYLHRKKAFGIWSLPTVTNARDQEIETTITGIMDMYQREVERNGWYGYFNYGDVMHSYDDSRGEWRYDVGGFAWDNTELGSPAMLWYQFLRTGDQNVWRMATAMTRHCSEVDTYHKGPHAGLGTRHNVLHWGCGAKEARVSEAWWNRFMYYLTADERLGDILHEVVDADTLLYILDPMRLAQPRSMYPCTAPARLRLGPDWFAYASNWLTDIERTPTNSPKGNGKWRMENGEWENKSAVKLMAGMKSIAGFRHGFFEGPKALGYDPATGAITNECDSTIQNTNHLMTIMGGFELMNEMEEYYLSSGNGTRSDDKIQQFFDTWLTFCATYKQKAWQLSKNKFRVPRLQAYASWRKGDANLSNDAWKDLLDHIPAYQLNQPLSNDPSSTQQGAVTQPRTSVTNDCSTWILDAIFMKEVLK